MFGHNKRLERRLKEQGGTQAWATVLESEKQWSSTGGVNVAPGQAGSMTIHQKIKLRVEPEGSRRSRLRFTKYSTTCTVGTFRRRAGR
jgi:hypothetical protein